MRPWGGPLVKDLGQSLEALRPLVKVLDLEALGIISKRFWVIVLRFWGALQRFWVMVLRLWGPLYRFRTTLLWLWNTVLESQLEGFMPKL